MSRNQEQTRALVDALRAYDTEELSRRLADAVRRASSGRVENDGFPRSSLAAPGGKNGVGRPTESAALARATTSDPTNQTARRAVETAGRAVKTLDELARLLGSLDGQRSNDSGCPVIAAAGGWRALYKDGVSEFVYKFRRRNDGHDPTIDQVRLYLDGKRVVIAKTKKSGR